MKPFAPIDGTSTVTLSAGTSTGRVRLAGMPRSGSFQVRVKNNGSQAASIKFGDATVTAALTDMEILGNTTEIVTVPNRDANVIDYVAGITATGTADLDFTTGQGGR